MYNIEKGKIYFVGISNTEVKFNVFNTLTIYSNGAGIDGKIVSSVKGKTSEKTGNLYLKVYGAAYIEAGDEKVLTGAKIFDNGDKTGRYVYEQKGNFSDYLDLYQSAIKVSNSIFYDSVQNGISAKGENDNAFIYKIDTIYPFKKLKLEADQPGGDFTNSLVYYSFDNVNWLEIKNDSEKDMTTQDRDMDRFQGLLQGDGNTKIVYIKVTYDKEDAREKTIHLFGLKNLKVNAQLIMGK